MKLLVCAEAGELDPVLFWNGVPGTSSIHVVEDLEGLPARLAALDRPDVIVLRCQQAGLEEGNRLASIQRAALNIPVVAWTPELTSAEAFRLCYMGADALVSDETPFEQRVAPLKLACARRKTGVASEQAPDLEDAPWRRQLVGNSTALRVVAELIRLLSPRRCNVLITGETGTGKEMVARAIHAASPRASQQMVSLNCNAIPAELLEAELFGHVKGAYTGAFSSRVGRFEQANRGTLFLDEIGDLPFPLQAKLLRVLQEREFQRLGSSETVKVDVRIIAATNANLAELVEKGKFRQDLYYRLNVAPIHLPPLRERPEDVPELALHFVEKLCRAEQIPVKSLAPDTVEWLQTFRWPGNVRQLENTIESAIALSGNRTTLRMADFSALLGGSPQQSRLFAMPSDGIDYNQVVGQFEKTLLTEALRLSGGSKKKAASLLMLKRTTFSAKLDALRIAVADVEEETEEFQSAIA